MISQNLLKAEKASLTRCLPGALGALQGGLQLPRVSSDSSAERADVLLDALGSCGGHTYAATMEPLLTTVAADHRCVVGVRLLAHAVEVLLILFILLSLQNLQIVLGDWLLCLFLQVTGCLLIFEKFM